MDKLSSAMARARALGRAAFIPFLSAGAPSLSATRLFLEALEESADIVELGVPFSDPVADGPVIQEASERALKAGATLDRILDLVAGLKAKGRYRPEILLFSYLNPVLAMGFSTFARRAARAGAAGALLVDLPPEEAGDYLAPARARGLGTVFMA
ncbi:MAG: tryptophan synthase subunit alpha, partial [Elusimicrobiota bacterium]